MLETSCVLQLHVTISIYYFSWKYIHWYAFLLLCLILNEFEFVLFCFLDLVMINRNQDQVWTGEILSPLCDTWGQRQQKLEPIILIFCQAQDRLSHPMSNVRDDPEIRSVMSCSPIHHPVRVRGRSDDGQLKVSWHCWTWNLFCSNASPRSANEVTFSCVSCQFSRKKTPPPKRKTRQVVFFKIKVSLSPFYLYWVSTVSPFSFTPSPPLFNSTLIWFSGNVVCVGLCCHPFHNGNMNI